MSIRSSMLKLSEKCGIDAETLRKRWAKGLRGDALTDPRGTIKTRAVVSQACRSVNPVRVPEAWE